MSDPRAIKTIYINEEAFSRGILSGTSWQPAQPLVFYRGSQSLIRAHLMMADGTTYFAPPAGATWLAGFDSVFTVDHADLVLSQNTQFNTPGDWDLLAPTTGKICWRMDWTSTTLKEAIGSAGSLSGYMCLWMTPSGESPVLLAQWAAVINNIAVDPTTATPVEGITHPTTTVFNSAISQIKTPTGGLYRLQNGALQLWNATQSKWHTLSILGAVDAETLDIGPGED